LQSSKAPFTLKFIHHHTCLIDQDSLPSFIPTETGSIRCHSHSRVIRQIPCSNCGGGDSWCRHLLSLREFRRAKSHCHLYGAQGQRQAYLLPHATMNFMGLDLTTSDRWHYKQQQLYYNSPNSQSRFPMCRIGNQMLHFK
ncbi:hypothetical protein TNCV_3018451, partial [Trichonephila clavipes]